MLTHLRVAVIAIATLSVAPGISHAQDTTQAGRLLMPGELQTFVRPTVGKEPWFGLFPAAGGDYELRRTDVKVEDAAVGCGGNGRRVSFTGAGVPLLLVSGLAGLREGRIDSVFAGRRFVFPAEGIPLKLSEEYWYYIYAFGSARRGPAETFVTDYDLVLRLRRQWQVVAHFARVDWDGPPQLLWAGDLDRDGRVDLLFDLRQSYVGHRYTLFASGAARGADLVTRVAELSTSGC